MKNQVQVFIEVDKGVRDPELEKSLSSYWKECFQDIYTDYNCELSIHHHKKRYILKVKVKTPFGSFSCEKQSRSFLDGLKAIEDHTFYKAESMLNKHILTQHEMPEESIAA